MNAQASKAFDFASETTKQLITLSTAILAITITFVTDILTTIDPLTKTILGIAWCSYLVSIIFGIWTLMALTGELAPMQSQANGEDEAQGEDVSKSSRVDSQVPSIRGTNVTLPSLLQISTFAIATTLIVIFGIRSLI